MRYEGADHLDPVEDDVPRSSRDLKLVLTEAVLAVAGFGDQATVRGLLCATSFAHRRLSSAPLTSCCTPNP